MEPRLSRSRGFGFLILCLSNAVIQRSLQQHVALRRRARDPTRPGDAHRIGPSRQEERRCSKFSY